LLIKFREHDLELVYEKNILKTWLVIDIFGKLYFLLIIQLY